MESPLKISWVAGAGTGERPCSQLTETAPQLWGIAQYDVRLRKLDGRCCTDDVDDGIHGPHLVEMHILRGYAVNFPSAFAIRLNIASALWVTPVGKVSFLNHIGDRAVMPVIGLILNSDLGL